MSDAAVRFADLALPPFLISALDEIGYETPSPIQAAAIPPLLAGQDIIGQAQTGTGKTAAFALPFLARIDPNLRDPQVLVLTPTRELAIQVAEAFQRYAHHLPGFHVLPLYGGQSMGQQLQHLRRPVHVVVGTPGRIMDHLRRETLRLEGLRGLVLDEADEMLRMGFIDDVEAILQHTPASRQTALFSATMPEPIRQVAQRHLRNPREIKIKAKTSTVEAVSQRYWQVAGLHKLDALTRILEAEELDAVLIFTRTKTATVELAERLEARGYACAALNGDLNQAQREKVVEQLKAGDLDIVIATDVAARGLDVPRISHVVNYDIPYDIESYVHRIGRTGRAGRTGEAILFVAPREIRMLRAIERATRQPIEPMRAPTREAIATRRLTQFRKAVLDTMATEDLAWFEEVATEIAQESGAELPKIAAALAFMVQRERPLRFEGAVANVAGFAERPALPREGKPVRMPGEPGESRAARPERAMRETQAEGQPARTHEAKPAREPREPRKNPPGRELRPERETGEASASVRATAPPPAPLADTGFAELPAGASRSFLEAARVNAGYEPPDAAQDEDWEAPLVSSQAERLKEFPEIPMVRYRIEVGHNQGITAKNIVGAIANEADIEARYIGRIDLYEDFSTIDLPEGMPRELLQHLRKVRFGKFRYDMSPMGAPPSAPRTPKAPRKPRPPKRG